MEDHITVWKKQRELLSSGLLQSHAMLYSIGNQLLCQENRRSYSGVCQKTQHLQKRLILGDAEFKEGFRHIHSACFLMIQL